MRYNKIRKMDISNGPGIRVSIFMQGCAFNCKNCFNPETHDFARGQEFLEETINKIIELSDKEFIEGLSILGGEPMHPLNREGTLKLAKIYKNRFPNKSIWIWTGFSFDKDLMKEKDLEYIDFLVDGRFIESLKNPLLHYRGSSNQRVIDVKRSLKSNKVIELKFEDELENKKREEVVLC